MSAGWHAVSPNLPGLKGQEDYSQHLIPMKRDDVIGAVLPSVCVRV